MNITLGADPELFLIQYGKYKSAVGLTGGGSKWNPIPIDNEGNAILEDNVAIEFNIKPSDTVETFEFNINKVLNYIKSKLPTFEFSRESAVSFPAEELETPEAMLFGCEPDFNAWTEKINRKPRASDKNLRSAGGHIHIGCSTAQEKPIATIRAMDLFLGVPSVCMDNNPKRRELYGKAGAFRPKPYGVEYRTLSNFWIFESTLIHWVYNQTKKAIEFTRSGSVILPEDYDNIINCINKSNHDLSLYLTRKYNVHTDKYSLV